MLQYDQALPDSLKKVQEWFGSIISRPIDFENRINPVAPSGQPIAIEACTYITPSPTLAPDQRIQLYNQQYWWRLLNTIHEIYPLVVRLFGYRSFNEILGFPYFVRYPPDTWSLHLVGNQLPNFIAEFYQGEDARLVLDSARLDNAFNHGFCAAHTYSNLSELAQGGGLNHLLSTPLYLQSHFTLIESPYDILTFRREFLKETPEYWLEHDFPNLDHTPTYIAVFRNEYNDVVAELLAPDEFYFLSLFENGTTIDAACEWLENQENDIFEDSAQHLQNWFHKWFLYQWLTPTTTPISD